MTPSSSSGRPHAGTLLGTLRFPPSADIAGLFFSFACPSTLRWCEGGLVLDAGETVTTNTYFNTFFESYYARYTSLERLYYELRLSGDFKIRVHRRRSPTDQECLSDSTHRSLAPEEPLRLDLPPVRDSQRPSRIYLEITSLKDGGVLWGGDLLTDEPPPSEVALAVVICTYKRNHYVKQTVDVITAEPRLVDEPIRVFVVDNGRDLSTAAFADQRVQIIPNQNVGGSGGFNRGLLAAKSSGTRFTHFLLMDDDVALCAEVLLRLLGILRFARRDLVICGSMLQRERPHILFEAGGRYGLRDDQTGPSPLGWAAIKRELYLQDPDALDKLLIEEKPDYGALWFLALSAEALQKSGLLMPFFIKVDDIELGLRLSAGGQALVAFPSIAVWHDAFEKKKAAWDVYYYLRNALICYTLHRPASLGAMLRRIGEKFLVRLLVFDYGPAELTLLAVEHYLMGPRFLASQPAAELHAKVLDVAGSKRTPTFDGESWRSSLTDSSYLSRTCSLHQRLLALGTLGGHLLPRVLLDDSQTPTLMDEPQQRLRVFPNTRLRLVLPEQGVLPLQMDQEQGRALIRRWLAVMLRLTRESKSVVQAWRDEAPKMVTEAFWREYLHLRE